LERRGFKPAAQAHPHTAEGLVRTIISHGRRAPVPELKKTLLRALREAGAVARKNFGRVTARYKGRANIVTQADLACEQRIRSMLFWDVNNGIARRAWAHNQGAIWAGKKAMQKEPKLTLTLPEKTDASLINKALERATNS